jgi:hypothetical protein
MRSWYVSHVFRHNHIPSPTEGNAIHSMFTYQRHPNSLSLLAGAEEPAPQRPTSVLADIGTGSSSGSGGPNVGKAAAAVVLGGALIFGAAAMAPPPFGPRPAVAAASAQSTHSTADVFAYKIQKVFGLPLFGKICCLFLFTVPMVGDAHVVLCVEQV